MLVDWPINYSWSLGNQATGQINLLSNVTEPFLKKGIVQRGQRFELYLTKYVLHRSIQKCNCYNCLIACVVSKIMNITYMAYKLENRVHTWVIVFYIQFSIFLVNGIPIFFYKLQEPKHIKSQLGNFNGTFVLLVTRGSSDLFH